MERDFSRPYYEPEPVDEQPRPRRSGKQAALLLLFAFVLGPIVLFGSRLLLANNDVGKVTFGTSNAECSIGGQATSFPHGSIVYGIAVLNRVLGPGETYVVRLRNADVVLWSREYTVTATGACNSELFDLGLLAPGTYRATYEAGAELLADGSFVVT